MAKRNRPHPYAIANHGTTRCECGERAEHRVHKVPGYGERRWIQGFLSAFVVAIAALAFVVFVLRAGS